MKVRRGFGLGLGMMASLAAAALMVPSGAAPGVSPLTIVQGPGASLYGNPGQGERIDSLGMESAFSAAFEGAYRRRRGGGIAVHGRKPGCRAHRRWARARASGIKGASRS